MDIVAGILGFVGFLAMAVGGIWLMVAAFRKSVLWGLGYLFVPFVGLVFLIIECKNVWKPFAINVVGALVVGGALAIFIPTHPELFDESTTAGTKNPIQQTSETR